MKMITHWFRHPDFSAPMLVKDVLDGQCLKHCIQYWDTHKMSEKRLNIQSNILLHQTFVCYLHHLPCCTIFNSSHFHIIIESFFKSVNQSYQHNTECCFIKYSNYDLPVLNSRCHQIWRQPATVGWVCLTFHGHYTLTLSARMLAGNESVSSVVAQISVK